MNISVVIPTYNRSKEVKETLKSIKKHLNEITEVLIVDQSKNDNTKKLVRSLKNKKIKCIHSNIPSITKARNLGVAKSSKNSDLICFLDDDVTIGNGYFNELKNVFISNPNTKGVAGYVKSADNYQMSFFETLLRKIFLFGHLTKNNADIISVYGNNYPANKPEGMIFSHWLPGVNGCYKKEVFKFQKFDENLLGYTVVEDIDFSYRLWKKFPGSLVITPKANILHRFSQSERSVRRDITFINQVDHFYFFLKNYNDSFLHRASFVWNLLGITVINLIRALSFKKQNILKLKFHFESLGYCIVNFDLIKKGKLRKWKKES